MTLLLTYAGEAEPTAAGIRTGGIPLVPEGFTWPTCRTCSGAQQFIGSLPLDPAAPDGDAVLAFKCDNDPGLCDEWDPLAGGNAALVVSGPRTPAEVPATGTTELGAVSALQPVEEPGDYEAARKSFQDRTGPRTALGQLGGEPRWIQGDETPTCEACGTAMALVAQLEEGHRGRTAANFGGGGCAYVFACRADARGVFLYQC